MPTEVKPLTGLFKLKDITRWHTTWHAFLCENLDHGRSRRLLTIEKFPCSLRSCLSLASPEDQVSDLGLYGIQATNQDSDFLGQEL